jgi:hypothetical protein
MTEQKRREGKLRPCSVCGQTNHSRPTNKLCPHYIPPRRTLTPLKRTSIIKSSLTNCCRNQALTQQIQAIVLRFRDITYLGSLFMQHAILLRLASAQPCPVIDQDFCYQIFGTVCGVARKAPQWIKDAFTNFVQLWPQGVPSVRLSFRGYTPLIGYAAREYATNCRNHVVTNFERRCQNWFLVRFSDPNDPWYLGTIAVKDRKTLASYAYSRAAGLDATGPRDQDLAEAKRTVEGFATTVNMGPTPITEARLSADYHLYIPFLYSVLQRIEQRQPILEPQNQNFASKGYIFRKLNEVSDHFVSLFSTRVISSMFGIV